MSRSEDTQGVEAVLDTKQCAEVALYMFKEWEKAMEPPLFIYKTFPVWLNDLISKEESNP